jgi:hypothetical protein
MAVNIVKCEGTAHILSVGSRFSLPKPFAESLVVYEVIDSEGIADTGSKLLCAHCVEQTTSELEEIAKSLATRWTVSSI